MDAVKNYLAGKKTWLEENWEGVAATAGTIGSAGIFVYNQNFHEGSIWNPVEAGTLTPNYLPGLDSIGGHGVGFTSLSVMAMEPANFPLKYATGGRDIPDWTKPIIGVGLIGVVGGWALKEGYMEYGVDNLETAGQFVHDLITYDIGPDDPGIKGDIDADDYWDMVFDVVPTAVYCHLKGYNSALREKISGLYQEAADGS